MSSKARAVQVPTSLPLQYLDIQITPLTQGQVSVRVQATLLDEDNLEFVGEDLAHEKTRSLTDLLEIIQRNVTALSLCPA